MAKKSKWEIPVLAFGSILVISGLMTYLFFNGETLMSDNTSALLVADMPENATATNQKNSQNTRMYDSSKKFVAPTFENFTVSVDDSTGSVAITDATLGETVNTTAAQGQQIVEMMDKVQKIEDQYGQDSPEAQWARTTASYQLATNTGRLKNPYLVQNQMRKMPETIVHEPAAEEFVNTISEQQGFDRHGSRPNGIQSTDSVSDSTYQSPVLTTVPNLPGHPNLTHTNLPQNNTFNYPTPSTTTVNNPNMTTSGYNYPTSSTTTVNNPNMTTSGYNYPTPSTMTYQDPNSTTFNGPMPSTTMTYQDPNSTTFNGPTPSTTMTYQDPNSTTFNGPTPSTTMTYQDPNSTILGTGTTPLSQTSPINTNPTLAVDSSTSVSATSPAILPSSPVSGPAILPSSPVNGPAILPSSPVSGPAILPTTTTNTNPNQGVILPPGYVPPTQTVSMLPNVQMDTNVPTGYIAVSDGSQTQLVPSTQQNLLHLQQQAVTNPDMTFTVNDSGF